MSTVYSAVLPPSLLVFFLIKLLSSVQTLQKMDFFSFLFNFEQQKSHLFLIKLLSSVQTLQLPAQFVLWHHRPKNMEQKMLPGKLVWKRVPTPTQALFKRRCHQMNLFGINDIRMRTFHSAYCCQSRQIKACHNSCICDEMGERELLPPFVILGNSPIFPGITKVERNSCSPLV